jgi:hypothetical protein
MFKNGGSLEGLGREMTQTLYTHMNKRKKKQKNVCEHR